MGIFDRLFGDDSGRLQLRADVIKKRLTAIDTELADVRERIKRAANSRKDSDLTNMMIAELSTAMGRANTGDQTMVRERELKAERATLEEELQQTLRRLQGTGVQ